LFFSIFRVLLQSAAQWGWIFPELPDDEKMRGCLVTGSGKFKMIHGLIGFLGAAKIGSKDKSFLNKKYVCWSFKTKRQFQTTAIRYAVRSVFSPPSPSKSFGGIFCKDQLNISTEVVQMPIC